mgnify:FL=1
MTVSRAINTPDRVSPATYAKIQNEISRQGYRPNLAARALATRQNSMIGMVVPSLNNQVFAPVIRGAHDAAKELGFLGSIQVINTDYDPQQEQDAFDALAQQAPKGVLWVSSHQQPPNIAEHLQAIRLLDDGVFGIDHAAAISDIFRSHTIRTEQCAFLSAGVDPRGQARKAAATQLGATVFDWSGTSSVEAGRALADQALDKGFRVLVCNNDDLALGAMMSCHALGLSVPNEVGISGYNDLDFAAHLSPALTSVAMPLYEIGFAASASLLNSEYQIPEFSASIKFRKSLAI